MRRYVVLVCPQHTVAFNFSQKKKCTINKKHYIHTIVESLSIKVAVGTKQFAQLNNQKRAEGGQVRIWYRVQC